MVGAPTDLNCFGHPGCFFADFWTRSRQLNNMTCTTAGASFGQAPRHDPPPPSNAMMKKVAPVAALIGAAALARMRPTPNKAAVVPPKKKRTDAPQKAPPNCKKRFPWRVVCLSLGAAALSRFFSAANRAARAAARVSRTSRGPSAGCAKSKTQTAQSRVRHRGWREPGLRSDGPPG